MSTVITDSKLLGRLSGIEGGVKIRHPILDKFFWGAAPV